MLCEVRSPLLKWSSSRVLDFQQGFGWCRIGQGKSRAYAYVMVPDVGDIEVV